MRHMTQFIVDEKPIVVIPKATLLVASLQLAAAIIFKVLLLALVLSATYQQLLHFHASLIIPMKMERVLSADEKQTIEVRKAFKLMWGREASIGIIEGIKFGAKSIRTIKVDPILLAILLDTESEGNLNAKSSKGYRGLMQTVSSTGIPEADIMHGAKMLDQKLSWKKVNPHRNLRIALALYKGGLSVQAFSQADQVLRRYSAIKTRIAS